MADSAKPETVRQRNPKFSSSENEALIAGVEKRNKILHGKFSSTFTSQDRTRAWAEIASEVNAVGDRSRSILECQTRFKNISQPVKKKAAAITRDRHRTGGGSQEVENLTAEEERLVGLIGRESVEGIPGGMDLAADLFATDYQAQRHKSSSSRSAFSQIDEELFGNGDFCSARNEWLDSSRDASTPPILPTVAPAIPSTSRSTTSNATKISHETPKINAPMPANSGMTNRNKGKKTYSESLLELEEEKLAIEKRKLDEMCGIRIALEENNKLQRELIEIKRRKLEDSSINLC